MRTMQASVAAVAFAFGLSWSVASAQRGVDDPEGVARQPAKPKVVSLSGKVLEVKTAPRQTTTGRSQLESRLIMKASDGKTLNIHLGPAAAVESVSKILSRGTEVKVEAFRTKKTEKGQYVARLLTVGDRTVILRDKALRPVWAGWGVGKERPVKIAVTAAEPSLDAAVDPRFGRCRYFVLVDAEQGMVEALKNTDAGHGNAGVQSAEMIAAKEVRVVLTGKCGPNALSTLSAAGIQVIPGCSGAVRAVIKQFKTRQLQP